MHDDKRWWRQESVQSLLTAQGEPTSLTRMMIAAYKQRTAVKVLLAVIDKHKVKLSTDEKELVDKVRKQHEKYMKEGHE